MCLYTLNIGTNLTNLASSVETLRSLSRLFPHLSDELNTNGGSHAEEPLPPKNTPAVPDSQDYVLSDLSATSSVTSSYSRSGMGKHHIRLHRFCYYYYVYFVIISYFIRGDTI